QEIVPVPVAKLPAALPAIEEKAITPAQGVAKLESGQPVTEPIPAPVTLTSREIEKPAKATEPDVTPAASSRTAEAARPSADTVAALPTANVAPPPETKPLELAVKEAAVEKPVVKDRPVAPPKAAIAKTPAASDPVAQPLASDPIKALEGKRPAVTALPPATEKPPAAEVAQKGETLVAEITKVPRTKVTEAPAARPHTLPEPAAARKIENPEPALAKVPLAESTEPPQARSSFEKSPEPAVARKSETPAPALGVVKIEPAQAIKPEAKLPIAAPVQESANEKPEQLALLTKPAGSKMEKPPLARPAHKSLEGFIIQIAFNDKEKAQSWAEKMQQRGYAVSVTAAGAEGSLRVRLGNFAVRDDAERQLRSFKQEGMSGIIINLPQAFRPQARWSVP
ncbi:MAG: SPOR domain-containing protein, partial [Candidatus Binatia bacterium]